MATPIWSVLPFLINTLEVPAGVCLEHCLLQTMGTNHLYLNADLSSLRASSFVFLAQRSVGLFIAYLPARYNALVDLIQRCSLLNRVSAAISQTCINEQR